MKHCAEAEFLSIVAGAFQIIRRIIVKYEILRYKIPKILNIFENFELIRL